MEANKGGPIIEKKKEKGKEGRTGENGKECLQKQKQVNKSYINRTEPHAINNQQLLAAVVETAAKVV